jgi:hypothetical protein
MAARKLLRVLILGSIVMLTGLSGKVFASRSRSASSALQATALSVTLSPSADNTLYEDSTGSTSNGAGEYFFVGRIDEPTDSIRRGLIRFDVTSSVPLTATIVNVTLYLTMSKTMAGPQPIALHRAAASWGEGSSNATSGGGGGGGIGAQAEAGDATWLHRFYSSTLWTTAGGDFASAASATTIVDINGVYTWSAPGLAGDVQAWLAAPSTNDGWVLVGNETSQMTAKRFDTKENSSLDDRPALVVTYLLLPNKVYLPLVSK